VRRDGLFRGRQRSFGSVLLLLAAAAIFQLAAPSADWARFVAIVLQGAVVIAALSAAGAVERVVSVAGGAYAVLVVASAAALLGPGSIDPAVPRITTLLLVLLTPPVVVAGLRRTLLRERTVTPEVVYAALCLYLLVGLGFAFAFGALEDLSGNPFFSGNGEATPNEFLYFSLTTLTTTGYGDFTAGTDLGRALAVTEALIGQVYLVTVIALLVSNLRPRAGRHRHGDA
jgi:hypothetical protein